jgi:NAD(P)-dependent dehydrogenase (short-subunit alcohol dehydrogenase family)
VSSHRGKVVLVTGAGRGIGQAIADAHAAAGASVADLDHDPALAEAAAEATCQRGARRWPFPPMSPTKLRSTRPWRASRTRSAR